MVYRFINNCYVYHNYLQVFEPADGTWGFQHPNGSWSGVVGDVARFEADTSMNIAITTDRGEDVDFTIGYTIDPLTFVISKPQVTSVASSRKGQVKTSAPLRF